VEGKELGQGCDHEDPLGVPTNTDQGQSPLHVRPHDILKLNTEDGLNRNAGE
jgi:hypothetical protein